MLTYPGFDKPDGKALPPHGKSVLDDISRRLTSGQQIVIPEALLRTPAPELPAAETPHEPWQMVVYDEEEAQRQTALSGAKQLGDLAKTMNAMLELSASHRRAKRDEALRLAEIERKTLEQERKAREERQRLEAERQEMIRQHKENREADAKNRLTAFRQKWTAFKLTFPMAPHLPDLVGDLPAMEAAKKWGPILRCLQQREEFIATAQTLADKYEAMVRRLSYKPYLQTHFNVALTTLAAAIGQDPVGTKGKSKLDHLNSEITNELSRYDRIYAAWNAALQTTQDRLGFIPKEKRVAQQIEAAIQQLALTILNDPYGAGHNAALKVLNEQIEKEVEKPVKEARKTEVYKDLYNRFIAREPGERRPPKRYAALKAYEKGLIRMIRNGDAADSAPIADATGNRNVRWERKSHDFRGALAPGLVSGGGDKAEYRLWQDVPRDNATTKLIAGATWYLTAERMTSYGRAGSDKIIFFYNEHSSSNQYYYGLVTHLPMRYDKTEVKERFFPQGFPAAPGQVT